MKRLRPSPPGKSSQRRSTNADLLMSHQRQMEWREKPTPQEWRGYQRLGAAVIASAVRDLGKPTRVGGESVRAGEYAQAFLAVSNPSLKFWCRVADLDMNAILRKYCKGGQAA